MEYLIEELLRPGARAAASQDPGLAGFAFDHRLDGLIIGERSWSRELFAIRVTDNVVTQEVLRQGEPLAWESGWDGIRPEDRPWLAGEPRPRSGLDDPALELVARPARRRTAPVRPSQRRARTRAKDPGG